jgi:hypothetical protein
MNPIGGELALHDELSYFFTDSGRSSLRLFCKNFPSKKILLPDFLCSVIIDILEQENMLYDFYHINEDLTIDSLSVKTNFDIFYLINYFGKKLDIPFDMHNKIVIEDNVFFIDFENHRNYKHWFAFNSYRKLTELADGSMIKSNLSLQDYRVKKISPFSTLKYTAKEIKYNFLTHYKKSEIAYLSTFEEGEALLDSQREIFSISDKSLGHLNKLITVYNTQKALREQNYNQLAKEFEHLCVQFYSDFYSYLVILTDDRDLLRKFLFSKNIFLPIHWPSSKGRNLLHKKILSIPLFYTKEEIAYLIKSIKDYYENN